MVRWVDPFEETEDRCRWEAEAWSVGPLLRDSMGE